MLALSGKRPLDQVETAPEHLQICREPVQPSQSQLATNWQPESHFLGDAEKSASIKKSNHR
jgi:hypothetical protein